MRHGVAGRTVSSREADGVRPPGSRPRRSAAKRAELQRRSGPASRCRAVRAAAGQPDRVAFRGAGRAAVRAVRAACRSPREARPRAEPTGSITTPSGPAAADPARNVSRAGFASDGFSVPAERATAPSRLPVSRGPDRHDPGNRAAALPPDGGDDRPRDARSRPARWSRHRARPLPRPRVRASGSPGSAVSVRVTCASPSVHEAEASRRRAGRRDCAPSRLAGSPNGPAPVPSTVTPASATRSSSAAAPASTGPRPGP